VNPWPGDPSRAPARLNVLYEDDSLIAVEKPAGIHTAPITAGEPDALLSLIITRYPEVARVPGRKEIEPGLLHRLDRDTSGVVLVARTAGAFLALREASDGGKVQKEYAAVCSRTVEPAPRPSELRIESRFSPFGPGRRMVRVIPPTDVSRWRGRETTKRIYVTNAWIEDRHGDLCLVRARISAGFRHQVRAHLASVGLAILGDPLYGAPAPSSGEKRMYLHACTVTLPHPASGELFSIVSPVPAAFQDVMR
jgi:23S rRNA pseudouridine1911/1915/1917 synthase